jgi:hypothetical protein
MTTSAMATYAYDQIDWARAESSNRGEAMEPLHRRGVTCWTLSVSGRVAVATVDDQILDLGELLVDGTESGPRLLAKVDELNL